MAAASPAGSRERYRQAVAETTAYLDDSDGPMVTVVRADLRVIMARLAKLEAGRGK